MKIQRKLLTLIINFLIAFKRKNIISNNLHTIIIMLNFIKLFLLFISLYHILNTIIVYWIFNGSYWTIFSLIKDILWILFIIFVAFQNHKLIIEFFIRFKKPIIIFSICIIIGFIVSYINWKWIKDMIIWYKYDLHFALIIISSMFIGLVLNSKWKENELYDLFEYLFKLIIFIIIFWVIRQTWKLWFKDFYYYLWYWPLSDYKVWDNPPIYYLTWYQWNPRLSWIFSWPNNYWYLLVWLFSRFTFMLSNLKEKKDKIIYWITYIFNWLFTLSRWLIVWIWAQIVIKSSFIIKYLSKKQIIIIGFIWFTILGLLTFRKWHSSIEHIKQSSIWIQKMIEKPLWYWLWTAWPSIHHNWSILPENTIIQIILDLWIIGFVFWMRFFVYLIRLSLLAKNKDKWKLWIYLELITIWIIWLFVEWLFLHVFEDSMVNYLIFVPWWILIGYLINPKELYTKWN